jgi:hypothetical protein
MLAVVILVGGCAGHQDGSLAASRQQGLPAHRPSLLDQEVIGRFVPADGQQNTAGSAFAATVRRLQKLIVAGCMGQYGLTGRARQDARYDERYVDQLSPSVPGWQGDNESGVPNLYNLPLLAHGLLGEILTGSPNPPTLPAAQGRAVSDDYGRCLAVAAQPFRALDAAGSQLEGPWLQQVARIQAGPAVRPALRGFGSCVRAQGAPAPAATSPDAFAVWLSDLVQPAADPARVATPVPVRVTQDRRWTVVFARCARPVLAAEGRLQLSQQQGFLAGRREQVQRLQKLASQVIYGLTRKYGPG